MPAIAIAAILIILFTRDLLAAPPKRSAAKRLGDALGDYLDERDRAS